MLQEGTVLQRDRSVRIWGKGAPGKTVYIRLQHKEWNTKADTAGKWELYIKDLKTGGPFTMEIRQDDEFIHLNEIYVGDLWVCAGQSNMELPVARVKDAYPDILNDCSNPYIRIFTVQEHYDFQEPAKELRGGQWKAAEKRVLEEFSTFSYFFAERLQKNLKIPIGIINVSKGGSPIEAWLDKDSIKDSGELLKESEAYQNDHDIKSFIQKNEEMHKQWYDDVRCKDAGIKNTGWYLNRQQEGWKTIDLPGWFDTEELKGFCGSIWLRKRFDVPPDMEGKAANLWLGTIVDSDETYINGMLVGQTGYQYPPRKYKIPKKILKKENNILMIRVICESGKGRLTPDKEYCLFSGDTRVDLRGNHKNKWEYRIGCRSAPAPVMDFISRKPTGLYNGILAPCMKMTVKGVVWYQGESNDKNAVDYEKRLSSLITLWRKGWGDHSLPFILIQLPAFSIDFEKDDHSWPVIREAQRCVAHKLPQVKMTVNLDLGEWNDLHPLRKKEAAYRAAQAAEAFDYKEERADLGPVPVKLLEEDHKVLVVFEHLRSGITVLGDTIKSVQIKGEDGEYYDARAWVENDMLIAEYPDECKKVCGLRYAWSNAPDGGLLADGRGNLISPFQLTTDIDTTETK